MKTATDFVFEPRPPIEFEDLSVPPNDVHLETEYSFAHFVIPIDRRAELEMILATEQRLIETLVKKGGLGEVGLDTLQSMAKAVSTVRRYRGIQKVEASAAYIGNALAKNWHNKIVIYAVSRDVLEGIRLRLRLFKPVVLYEGTDPARRLRAKTKYKSNPRCRVMLCQIKTAGLDLELSNADAVYFVEPSWNAQQNAQALLRVHTREQKNELTCTWVGIKGTIDADIVQAIKRRTRRLIEKF